MRALGLVIVALVAYHTLTASHSAPKAHTVPNSSVAAEVCEGDGAVQSVTLAGSTYRVRCASGIVQEVTR